MKDVAIQAEIPTLYRLTGKPHPPCSKYVVQKPTAHTQESHPRSNWEKAKATSLYLQQVK